VTSLSLRDDGSGNQCHDTVRSEPGTGGTAIDALRDEPTISAAMVAEHAFRLVAEPDAMTLTRLRHLAAVELKRRFGPTVE
jgi:hypothetical protein